MYCYYVAIKTADAFFINKKKIGSKKNSTVYEETPLDRGAYRVKYNTNSLSYPTPPPLPVTIS
jgi:hypothetical protein